MKFQIKFRDAGDRTTKGSLVEGQIKNGFFTGRAFIGGGAHISSDKSVKINRGGGGCSEKKIASLIRAQTSFWKIFGESSIAFAEKHRIEGTYCPN